VAGVDALRALCDPDRIAPWLDAQGLEPAQPLTVERIAGGMSNEMFVLTRGGTRWVLRRPSGVPLPRADDGLRREFRFLRALDGTAVPHPHPVVHCDDPSVIGSTFYVMAFVDGFRPDADTVNRLGFDDEARREVAFGMVDALAALHAVDHVAAGLADLGRVEDFHERQVVRWMRQLASYEGRTLEGIAEVAGWLDAHRPASFRPTIMHADFHGMNVLITHQRPYRVAAILDWETCTIGDPLLDLAAFVRNFGESRREGWPSPDVLVARYEEQTGTPVPDLTYYIALSRFRLAVLTEGIYQRSKQDPTRPLRQEMGDVAVKFVAEARADIGLA
jgi:aminoglycoside phosphotransferase (APT) family kinase protein